MIPDDVAELAMNSRGPRPPLWRGHMDTCTMCRFRSLFVNVEGRCAACQGDHEWARENKLVCDFIHRGVVVGAPRIERGCLAPKANA